MTIKLQLFCILYMHLLCMAYSEKCIPGRSTCRKHSLTTSDVTGPAQIQPKRKYVINENRKYLLSYLCFHFNLHINENS